MGIIPLAHRPEYIEEIAKLHHEEWSHLNASLTLKERIAALKNAARVSGIPSIYIALLKEELAGSAAIIENDMGSMPYLSPWLAAVYVKESFRKQGIATQLIARCVEEAVQSESKGLYLYTVFAGRFYEKLGWCQLERCEYRGVEVDVMRKPIAS